MLSRTARVTGLAAVALGLTAVAGACSSSEAGSTASTITIRPQSYQSKPAATLAPESTTAATAGDDGTTNQEQHYEVKSGDYPSEIAALFEIELEALLNYNDWELSGNIVMDFPSAGEVIRIPPGAKFIDPNAPTETETTEAAESTGGTTSDGAIIETTAAPVTGDASDDRCVPGTYTVEAGDYPNLVAQKFDVTGEALAAANASTQGYNVFYEGLEIIIPAAEDC